MPLINTICMHAIYISQSAIENCIACQCEVPENIHPTQWMVTRGGGIGRLT